VNQHSADVLKRGHLIPHFEVTTLDGSRVRYADHWQHRNLLLISLPESGAEDYVRSLGERMSALTAHDTVCVLTSDRITGIPPPSIVVADKWGEIQYAASGGSAADLPGPEELIEWLRWVQMHCPECEGENR
jgi:hypothetical protein